MNRNWRMTFVWTAAILALNNGFQLMVIYNAPQFHLFFGQICLLEDDVEDLLDMIICAKVFQDI